MCLISIIQKKYERILTQFKEEVCRNPDADLHIRSLAAEFIEMAKERERSVVFALLLNLYGQDVHSLRRDLSKLKVLGTTAQATPTQRAALLRCLYGVVSLYVDDLEEILAKCDQIGDACKDSSLNLDT